MPNNSKKVHQVKTKDHNNLLIFLIPCTIFLKYHIEIFTLNNFAKTWEFLHSVWIFKVLRYAIIRDWLISSWYNYLSFCNGNGILSSLTSSKIWLNVLAMNPSHKWPFETPICKLSVF